MNPKTQSVCKYREAIEAAMKTANGRWSEWGGRAESVAEILENVLNEPVAEPASTGEQPPLTSLDEFAKKGTDSQRECCRKRLAELRREVERIESMFPELSARPSEPSAPQQRVKDFDWQCDNCGFRDDPTIPGKPTICPKCGWNKWTAVSATPNPPSAPKTSAEQQFTVSYEFLYKIWQAVGSVPQGVNQICSGVYEVNRDAFTALENLFNAAAQPVSASAPSPTPSVSTPQLPPVMVGEGTDREDVHPAWRAWRKGLPKSVLLRPGETENELTQAYDAIVKAKATDTPSVSTEPAKQSMESQLSWLYSNFCDRHKEIARMSSGPCAMCTGQTLAALFLKHGEILWTAVSKLESQICRNPNLPPVYREIMSGACEALREIDKTASDVVAVDVGLEAPVISRAAPADRPCEADSPTSLSSNWVHQLAHELAIYARETLGKPRVVKPENDYIPDEIEIILRKHLAAPSVAGTQPTHVCDLITAARLDQLKGLLEHSWDCAKCEERPCFICLDCEKTFCEPHGIKAELCAAQGTPQAEEIARKIMDEVRRRADNELDNMGAAEYEAILRPYFPPAGQNDKEILQVNDQRDHWEEVIGNLAVLAGCEEEWSNLHEHGDCIAEEIHRLRAGSNYIADDEIYPTRIEFANGRIVTIKSEDSRVFLGIEGVK
jgi:hypothetical protein